MITRTMTILLVSIAALLHASASDLPRHIPATSCVIPGYNDIDSVKSRIDNSGPVDIEGLWLMSATQTLVVIEPATEPTLAGAGFHAWQIVIISSPRKSLRPGTTLGYIIPTARKGHYEARIYTSRYRSILQKHRGYTLDLTDESHLTMTADKSPWRITLHHSLKFLFRAAVSTRPIDSPTDEGFIKQYPYPDGQPLKPVYL